MGKKQKQWDAIQEWVEFQDHRFEPGHWAGRVVPWWPGKLSKRSAYILIAAGTINMVIVLVPLILSVATGGPPWHDWSQAVGIGFLVGLFALMIASGAARVVRHPRRGKRSGG